MTAHCVDRALKEVGELKWKRRVFPTMALIWSTEEAWSRQACAASSLCPYRCFPFQQQGRLLNALLSPSTLITITKCYFHTLSLIFRPKNVITIYNLFIIRNTLGKLLSVFHSKLFPNILEIFWFFLSNSKPVWKPEYKPLKTEFWTPVLFRGARYDTVAMLPLKILEIQSERWSFPSVSNHGHIDDV